MRRFARSPDRVRAHGLDSTSPEAAQFFQGLAGSIRLFSIAGGHTRQHTVNDLRIGESCLSTGGILFVDDYFHPDWPGVTQGLVDYLGSGGPLVPIATLDRKMILSGVSYAGRYAAALHENVRKKERFRAKRVSFVGNEFLSIRYV